MNGWLKWISIIVGSLIVVGVGASVAFTNSISKDITRVEERQGADHETLMNTRLRAIVTEAQSNRVATEWDQFKEWYKLTESRNQDDHGKILAAIESLKK